MAIALHTFFALVFRWRPSANNRMPIFVITGIWLFLILLVGISLGTHKGKDYYGDTQFCRSYKRPFLKTYANLLCRVLDNRAISGTTSCTGVHVDVDYGLP